MSTFCILLELTGGGSGGDNWSYKTCKAPVKMSPPTNRPFLSPNQQCQSTEGNSCVAKYKNETQERQHINQNAKHQHKTKAVFANAKYTTPDPHSPVHRTNNSAATDIRQPKTPRLIITHTSSAQTITTVLAKNSICRLEKENKTVGQEHLPAVSWQSRR